MACGHVDRAWILVCFLMRGLREWYLSVGIMCGHRVQVCGCVVYTLEWVWVGAGGGGICWLAFGRVE